MAFGGLMVAVVQLSIGLGSTGGGLLFDHTGYQSTLMCGAALLNHGGCRAIWN